MIYQSNGEVDCSEDHGQWMHRIYAFRRSCHVQRKDRMSDSSGTPHLVGKDWSRFSIAKLHDALFVDNFRTNDKIIKICRMIQSEV